MIVPATNGSWKCRVHGKHGTVKLSLPVPPALGSGQRTRPFHIATIPMMVLYLYTDKRRAYGVGLPAIDLGRSTDWVPILQAQSEMSAFGPAGQSWARNPRPAGRLWPQSPAQQRKNEHHSVSPQESSFIFANSANNIPVFIRSGSGDKQRSPKNIQATCSLFISRTNATFDGLGYLLATFN